MASNAENVSIWWRHHVLSQFCVSARMPMKCLAGCNPFSQFVWQLPGTADLQRSFNNIQITVVWRWSLWTIGIQSTHSEAVTTNIWQLRPTHDSYDHTQSAVTTNWCFRKMTVTTNSSESKHADCVQTEQRKLSFCSGSWSLHTSLSQDLIVQPAITVSWWYPRLFGLAVFGRRHLGWW